MTRFAIALAALALASGCTGTPTGSNPGPGADPEGPGGQPSDAVSVAEPSRGATGQSDGRVPSRDELVGRWRPVELGGEKVTGPAEVSGEPVVLTFDEFGFGLGWSAYDGCNWVSGRARLDVDGGFSTSHRSSTQRGCLGGTGGYEANAEAVTAATRAALVGRRLELRAADGSVLGAYLPAGR